MKRILFLGVLIFFLTSGTACMMGPMMGMMGGQKNNDTMEGKTQHMPAEKDNKGATKSGQSEMDSPRKQYDKSDSDSLIGRHSGTTQDDASADKKTDAVRDKQEHTH